MDKKESESRWRREQHQSTGKEKSLTSCLGSNSGSIGTRCCARASGDESALSDTLPRFLQCSSASWLLNYWLYSSWADVTGPWLGIPSDTQNPRDPTHRAFLLCNPSKCFSSLNVLPLLDPQESVLFAWAPPFFVASPNKPQNLSFFPFFFSSLLCA